MPADLTARPRGPRIGRHAPLAIVLTTVVPLAVLAYTAVAYVLPNVERGGPRAFLVLLIVAAALSILTGGYLLWRLSRVVLGLANAAATLAARDGDVGSLMDAFSKMLATIEQQTGEIGTYQKRLDDAYRELETTNARLKETSFRDEVTGLYNRRFFSVRLEEELSRHRRFNHPVSIVLFDLDGFKAVNDELGHTVGDETLRDIGQILMKHSRGINVVSRYGGDEFAILLVETSKAGARLYADRIRQVVSGYPFSHGKRITASFGIASLPEDDAVTSEDLFRLADEALYIAKRGGKNQVAVVQSHEKVEP